MTTISTRRAVRGSAAVAIAVVGLFGLAACSAPAPAPADEPTTSETPTAEPTETTEPSEEPAASDATLCSAEQITTLSAAGGVAITDTDIIGATAVFEPEAVIADLPAVCEFAITTGTTSVAYAVLPGGAATTATVVANANAAGIPVTEAGGTFTGMLDGVTLVGVPFTTITQETAGFENVDDLIVVLSTRTG